ncbi:DMT family transporter [Burkholderia plantarii]|uniref:DMT family transporter n=1 Tax=Burkholderia plantarii TaxID=41899 RepID=UPI0018DC0726|nr:DMT family transporter [Burkholderia plantarii]MBI0329445.1 DMT family transporter [Burkholderia plantarii]
MATLSSTPWEWAWVPIVLCAAFGRTVRNAAQRSLTEQAGTLPATLVRFLYGLPCALVWLLLLERLGGGALPDVTPVWAGWLTLGAVAQLSATALLLMAIRHGNFVVAVTYSKTEPVQVALFSLLFLGEVPGEYSILGMLIAMAGVALLTLPRREQRAAMAGSWLGRSTLYGLGAGALFALMAVGYRAAALHQPHVTPWLNGAWGVLWAQAIQSALLGGYLLATNRPGLRVILRVWRFSTMVGTVGALATIGELTSLALHGATDVRTLGLIEVLFSYLVSRRFLREKLGAIEGWGIALVTSGLVVVCAQW